MDLNALYERKPTTLIEAVRKGDIDSVTDLLQRGVSHPNSADHRGWTSLHEATALNQLEIVKVLLNDERTNPEACAHDGDLALDVAIDQNASVELVDCLARCTPQFNQEDYASCLLYEAARKASACVVRYLIDNSPVDISGYKHFAPCSPVFIAMARNDDDVIEVLLEACGDVNNLYTAEYHQKTIIFAIEANCSLHIIKILLNKGATLNFDTTALMHAISSERIDVALELLKHDVDVNHDYMGSSALTLAILIRQRELVKEILSLLSISKLESLCEKQNTNGVICCALSQYDDQILSMLLCSNLTEPILEAPVGIRFRLTRLNIMYTYTGPLAFFLKEKMAAHGDETLSIMQFLLLKGISIEPRKLNYMPPLVGALLSRREIGDGPPDNLKPTLKMLLDAGVNVDHMSTVLPDALLTAIHRENLEAFLMILPYSQYTPCDIVRTCIEQGMDFVCNFILENMIDIDDFSELKNVYYSNEDSRARRDELFSRFSFKVNPLTVIARRKVRQCFKHCRNSSEFLDIFNKLTIPATLKCYLRYFK